MTTNFKKKMLHPKNVGKQRKYHNFFRKKITKNNNQFYFLMSLALQLKA